MRNVFRQKHQIDNLEKKNNNEKPKQMKNLEGMAEGNEEGDEEDVVKSKNEIDNPEGKKILT